jgi:hypothetical protein
VLPTRTLTRRRLITGLAACAMLLTASAGCGDNGKVGGVQVQEDLPDVPVNLKGSNGNFKPVNGVKTINFQANTKLAFFDLVITAPESANNTRFALQNTSGEVVVKGNGTHAVGQHTFNALAPGTYQLLAGDNRKSLPLQSADMNQTGILIEIEG